MKVFIDTVVEEVRQRGRAVTAKYGNETKAIMDALRQFAKEHPERVVDQIRVVRSQASEAS